MALFSQNAKSLSSTNGKIHKVEFKAGRMYLVSNEEEGVTKKIVHPDLRLEKFNQRIMIVQNSYIQ